MGRASCCEKTGLKKGPWTPKEDKILADYIEKNGDGSWRGLPKLAGLLRCGKSCRLRWTNHLKPGIKRGSFTIEEEQTLISLHAIVGNRWSAIASQIPGRTDNGIKNFWNTHLKKRLGLDPLTYAPRVEVNPTPPQMCKALALARHKAQWENARLEAEARLSRESLPMSSNYVAGYHTNNTVEVIMMPSDNAPTDYFLNMGSSEARKIFRKKSRGKVVNKSCKIPCHLFDQNHPNGRGDDQVLASEIPPRSSGSVSSLYCASTQHSSGQSFNPFSPNDEDKKKGSQLQCNSSSAEWIVDCNVKTHEVLACIADMTMDQTEYRAFEDFYSSEETDLAHMHYTGCPELLLEFPHNNNSSIDCMITELSPSFQQQLPWQWPEIHLEDNKDDMINMSIIAHS